MPGRVLVVAYNFPPVGGIGIQRTLKNVKYLPRSGWEPVVLTARNPGKLPWDEEAERDLPPDLVVERAFSPEPVKLRRALGRAARRLSGRSGGRAIGGSTYAGRGSPASSGSRSTWTGCLLRLWGTAMRLTFFPDEEVGWVPFAIRRGLTIHRDTPIDVVYSSAAPVSCHLAAALIARRVGVPWVADFRDPWIGNAFAPPPPVLHRYLQTKIERRMVDIADRLVFATPGFLEGYVARYPWASDRLLTIPNGYDRADFPPELGARRPGDGGRFRLVYTGSLYGERELEIFLQGLELAVERQPELVHRLEVEFVGALNQHNQAVAARHSQDERIGRMLRFEGFVSHTEAVARLATADALLQLLADDPGKSQIQGGKLTEYLGMDRQILAVVPEGHARAMLRELNWGIVADPTPEGVALGIERLLAAPAPKGRADPEGRYDRVNLARRLAELLDEVVAERKSR